jgi:asparaginyl-tRNA synthetase
MRIRHEVVRSIRDFFDDKGFLLVDTPIFTPSACEGTTTLFETDYFGEPAYLSQSGQLYNEATAMAYGKVYCFGPTFRAEKSKTRRHLTEFWQVEPEVAYAELDEITDLAEEFVAHVVERVLKNRRKELETLERPLAPLEKVQPPFPRISYEEAVEMLKKDGTDFSWGDDFGAPHEAFLSEQFDRPVFVHHYPAKCKAFYMKRDADREELALAVDMLAPEGYGEIIGGGQREEDLKTLKLRLKEHDLPEESFEWYLDLRRFGSVVHSGFGLGLERTIAWICKLPHLRETISFPRLLERVYP